MALNKPDLSMLQAELQRLVQLLRSPVIVVHDPEVKEGESISRYSAEPRKVKVDPVPSSQTPINVRKEIMNARLAVS